MNSFKMIALLVVSTALIVSSAAHGAGKPVSFWNWFNGYGSPPRDLLLDGQVYACMAGKADRGPSTGRCVVGCLKKITARLVQSRNRFYSKDRFIEMTRQDSGVCPHAPVASQAELNIKTTGVVHCLHPFGGNDGIRVSDTTCRRLLIGTGLVAAVVVAAKLANKFLQKKAVLAAASIVRK
jgi:hypothetical protein